MNKLCSVLVQTCVFKNHQLSNLSKVAYFASNSFKNDEVPKKVRISPKITLISEANKIEIMTLDAAKRLSTRRDLKLVKIMDLDAKTQRSVYKLMTGSEFHSEELKRREEKKIAKKEPHIKGEKLLSLSDKISSNDLNSKISTCVKWILKYHEVRVVVNGNQSDSVKADKIILAIEEGVTECGGRILQKRTKDGTTRFSILPTIKKDVPLPAKADDKKLLEPASPIVDIQRTMHTSTA